MKVKSNRIKLLKIFLTVAVCNIGSNGIRRR